MNAKALQIRTMGHSDIPFADSLRHIAGWNQSRADWERFLKMEPKGCFLAEYQNTPVGTATTVTYDNKVAWIGMVLVHPDHRRKGIGRALLLKCIEHLQNLAIPSIKLDATPAGQSVYEALGFKPEWTLSRWERSKPTAAHTTPNIIDNKFELEDSKLEAISRLDQSAFGVSRKHLLGEISHQSCSFAEVKSGFGFIRTGAKALQIGPVIAETERNFHHIIQLIAYGFLKNQNYRIFWDIPDQNLTARCWAEKNGFTIQRTLTRMFLGSNPYAGNPRMQYAIASPDLG